MLENAIVAAGGYGTRLEEYKNPLHCKSLITDDSGVTLLEHTLTRLNNSFITKRALIVSRGELRDKIENIADRVGIPYTFIDDSSHNFKGVRSLPLFCKTNLEDQPFLIICGHAPAPIEHLQNMLRVMKNHQTEVISLYKNRNESPDKILKVEVNNEGLVNRNDTQNPNFMAESPFILIPGIIDLIEKDNCEHWLGYYINQQLENGTEIYGIKSEFAPEADTSSDLDKLLSELRTNKI